MILPPHNSIIVLYDADCYLCKHFQTYMQIKQQHNIIYKDIHEDSDYRSFLIQQWYNLDHGIIIDIDGEIYQWKEAILRIEWLIKTQHYGDRMMKFGMKNNLLRTVWYPIAQMIRKISYMVHSFRSFIDRL